MKYHYFEVVPDQYFQPPDILGFESNRGFKSQSRQELRMSYVETRKTLQICTWDIWREKGSHLIGYKSSCYEWWKVCFHIILSIACKHSVGSWITSNRSSFDWGRNSKKCFRNLPRAKYTWSETWTCRYQSVNDMGTSEGRHLTACKHE